MPVASGMTEQGAGGVRLNELLGGSFIDDDRYHHDDVCFLDKCRLAIWNANDQEESPEDYKLLRKELALGSE